MRGKWGGPHCYLTGTGFGVTVGSCRGYRIGTIGCCPKSTIFEHLKGSTQNRAEKFEASSTAGKLFLATFFIRTYPSSAKWQALQEYVGRLKLMKASFKPKMESLKSEPALFYLRRMLNYVNQYFYWRVNFKTFVGIFFEKI